VLTPELSLAWSFDPAPWFQAFLNVAVSRDFVLASIPGEPRPSEDVELEGKEAYVRLGSLAEGPSVQVGRQRFEDEREWLYDEELDAIRLRYGHGALAIELSVSRDGLVQKDLLGRKENEEINNYIVMVTTRFPREIELEGYVIVRDDQAPGGGRPAFLGLRSRGEPVADLDYWFDLAFVAGREGSSQLRGWAVDLGVTYELQVGPRPSLTLGVAFGSGDRHPDDGHDGNFRQTGLQENEGDFGGTASFRYYGEVLDPELSNLAILTAGVGIRPTETFSVDLVYHYYLQHRASSTLRSAAIDAEPSGRSRQLGHGLDLIVGLVEILDRIDVKAILGYFFPGRAFPGGDGSWIAAAELQFRF
jgi:alginate production protein